LQVSHPTVGRWRQRFRAARLAGLRDAPRPGRPRIHDEKRIARLIAKALNAKPTAGARWSVRALSRAARVSKSTVWRYLRRYEAQPYRDKSVVSSD
jgi:DNA invertase Pin-like site-specific DNA recombinase